MNSEFPWPFGISLIGESDPLLSPEVEGNDMSSESRSLLPEDEWPSEYETTDMLLRLEVNDMSSKSWRINLDEFPALTERRDAEHGSCTLCRLLRTPSKPSSQSLCM